MNWIGWSNEYKLAVSVLNQDFQNAYSLMKEIGPENKRISSVEYRDWPLFIEIRKEDEFHKVYEEIFGHQLAHFTSEENDDETDAEHNSLTGS